MDKLGKYVVSLDSDLIENYFGDITPFNLKKDLRKFDDKDIDSISSQLILILNEGPKKPGYVILKIKDYKTKKVKYSVTISKIRIINEKNNKGKSSGYRCIVLVNGKDRKGLLLHIYSKSNKVNIGKIEENKLQPMLDRYYDALQR